jgi:hypothetical protein
MSKSAVIFYVLRWSSYSTQYRNTMVMMLPFQVRMNCPTISLTVIPGRHVSGGED